MLFLCKNALNILHPATIGLPPPLPTSRNHSTALRQTDAARHDRYNLITINTQARAMRNTDIVILKALLTSRSEYVSGNQLAQELGISRVGVWARLEKLREMNFSLEAVRHRGYRLLQEPVDLNEDLIRAYLEIFETPLDLTVLPIVDSTNSEAERRLAMGVPAPFVVMALQQEAGRGRMGRVWHSPGEGNIYASFAFRPQLPPSKLQKITLWVGVKVVAMLQREFDCPVGIKWPNDILLQGKKVGGILTEARIDADRSRDLIFGIGLNVHAKTELWPPAIASMATALASTSGQLSINRLAARLIHTVLTAYNCYLFGQIEEEFKILWDRYDLLKNKAVHSHGEKPITGVALGINEDGCLQVQTENGTIHLLHSGEVSLGSAQVNSSCRP